MPTLPHARPPLFARVAAEMIGTFALVYAGCGAIMVDAMSAGALGHAAVCGVFGAVVMVMVYATGHLSGAHFNPAVTLGFASTGHFPWREAPAYIGGQLVAALLAAFTLRACLGDVADFGMTRPLETLGMGATLGIEGITTFFLMFVIAAVATDGRAEGALAGVAIGGTVLVGAMLGGPVTGGSMNPARSLGPAMMAGVLEAQWLYVVGPILGAQAGAWAYEWVRRTPAD